MSRPLFILSLLFCCLFSPLFQHTTPIIAPPIVPVIERHYGRASGRGCTGVTVMGSPSNIPLHLVERFLPSLICQLEALRFLLSQVLTLTLCGGLLLKL